ncbi:hypothetical protein N7517_003663 [Penicillium concentricum]|uniref:Uncharacterized protein n=1 Tax=Penicillium concentricum TaxID=293559 RepID=A0A9W9S4T2_9EURO|nr:uncharacterized protein N7517_003663 [Penicillium concentricum]KAJ5371657.1 hypothetical protein N7517_003663 [Penicillium concentricum]
MDNIPQRGGHTAAIPAATTSAPISLGEGILTLKTAAPPGAPSPPVKAAGGSHILSACKPRNPRAKERVGPNTERVVEFGGLKRECIDHRPHRGEHAASTTPATTSPEISLGESILKSKIAPPPRSSNVHIEHPPINAAAENYILATCKPDAPSAKQRRRGNTQWHVESGVVGRLSSDQTLDASLFDQTKISDISEPETNTDDARCKVEPHPFSALFEMLNECPDEFISVEHFYENSKDKIPTNFTKDDFK